MFLDANFFVFAATGTDATSAASRSLLTAIQAGTPAWTSALVLDETMWALRKTGRRDLVRPVIEELYTLPSLMILDVTADIPLRALDLMEKHHLKPRDAFHLAVMRKHGIKRIVTTDIDFDNIPGVKRVALV